MEELIYHDVTLEVLSIFEVNRSSVVLLAWGYIVLDLRRALALELNQFFSVVGII